jgi:hypothetical protein
MREFAKEFVGLSYAFDALSEGINSVQNRVCLDIDKALRRPV